MLNDHIFFMKDLQGIELLEINKLENLLAVITHEHQSSSVYNIFIYDIQRLETTDLFIYYRYL